MTPPVIATHIPPLSFGIFPRRSRGGASWLVALLLALPVLAADAPRPAAPLPRAHAHNDYRHPRPLLDALDHGFCSVEADVWLVNGELLVAHDRDKTDPARTLQRLYLDPLFSKFKQHDGRIHPGHAGPVILLIDFKSPGAPTYAALRDALKPYAAMLTRFEEGETRPGAVTVVVSGDRPRDVMRAEATRYAFFDGRLEDLGQSLSPDFMPLVSADWRKVFKWKGVGPFPDAERELLKRLVARAHAEGKKLRFWAAPDSPAAWRELLDADADLVNTDRLPALRDFLLQPPPPAE